MNFRSDVGVIPVVVVVPIAANVARVVDHHRWSHLLLRLLNLNLLLLLMLLLVLLLSLLRRVLNVNLLCFSELKILKSDEKNLSSGKLILKSTLRLLDDNRLRHLNRRAVHRVLRELLLLVAVWNHLLLPAVAICDVENLPGTLADRLEALTARSLDCFEGHSSAFVVKMEDLM